LIRDYSQGVLQILLFLVAFALPAKPARYVTDNAGVLGQARADALNEKLAQFERDTSNQVLVYVDRNLPPDTTIEEMGAEAIRKWGVGQKGKDNGAILFVFTGARKMRIEVGYGLESTLTDAKSKRITSTVIKPLMQRGDMAGGVEAGVDAMLAAIRGADFKGRGTTRAQRAPAHAVPFAGLLAVLGGVVVLAVVIIVIVWSRRGRGGTSAGWSTFDGSSSSSSSSWSSSPSDSSSSSGSDFSGGGGDGGGGGASDSW
jgi:uncharacterized protein